jgi:hypothetical protein
MKGFVPHRILERIHTLLFNLHAYHTAKFCNFVSASAAGSDETQTPQPVSRRLGLQGGLGSAETLLFAFFGGQ